ncbi:LOW QUALITY PROTEIN: required for drug-induced death protein 1 [Mesoplodon densirostris]|uniref:LOW QUALITY PROTEIN: required for drug-induced death protein 1 n=1 Tax=Mesoplodon densirostris TaxID=48708 RepID=UPI0028DC1D01|nr:LOW QUALITY PROTEIN: required for drug-induced death protein 1 [Mesoplodon densirostris]
MLAAGPAPQKARPGWSRRHPGPRARGRCDPKFPIHLPPPRPRPPTTAPPPRPGWGGLGRARAGGGGGGAGWAQRLVSSCTDLSRRACGTMTVGARLRSKAASSLPRCRPLARGRGRTEGDEEAAAILEHLESGAEAAESGASAQRPGTRSARRVHLAVLPERYEPLEEPAPGEKPKKRYRQKLKKYGKNVGKVITKGCRYIVVGLQGFAAAYSAPFGVATSVVSFVR